ncbi:MAG: hypothetical protein KF734_05265 [Saprospiraceae bacterium]|nr:hypothetical protein [Saprospiraceae bacterium]
MGKRADKENLQHWLLAAYGPTRWLELTAGGVWGADFFSGENKTKLAYALPLLQAKFLFKEYFPNEWPGMGLVVGTFLPYGRGSFRPPGYGTFGFFTITQALGEGEKVLLHANAGGNYLHIAGEDDLLGTWGLGTQVKTFGGFHLVGEIFSGDPYVPGAGVSWQFGFRHFFSDLFQIDGTLGKGIGGAEPLPFWASLGARIVFTTFQKK